MSRIVRLMVRGNVILATGITDMDCTKAILNAIYGYKVENQPRYDIIITLKNDLVYKVNDEPILMSEVINRINHLIKPTIYGKYIVKFEIIQISSK